MGFIATRLSIVGTYSLELFRQGLPKCVGDTQREAVFILDGVGGFQFVPLLVRRMLREKGACLGTIMCRWQFGLPVEIWTDLMWASRNRRKAAEIAEQIRAFRRENPQTIIHVIGYSGGCGIAVWTCEQLGSEATVETLILACPAISPGYNLGPALRNVKRCYALVSHRDRWILGPGTTIFGTVDRQFTSAAGRVGFRRPPDLSPLDAAAYDRLWQVRWTPELQSVGHRGGHTGWANLPFLREHLLPMLHGEPRLALARVE